MLSLLFLACTSPTSTAARPQLDDPAVPADAAPRGAGQAVHAAMADPAEPLRDTGQAFVPTRGDDTGQAAWPAPR